MIRQHGQARERRVRTGIAGGLVALLLGATLVAVTGPPASAATPIANPTIPAQCGLGVTLVLDASGSVQTSNAVGAVRSAAESFLDAFEDTGSTARVLQFASLSEELAPREVVTAASLATGGAFRDAVNGYYNPIPPRPGSVQIKRYNSGNPSSASSWQSANSSNQYTNWDQSLRQTASDAGDLVVYITDGDPTAYDFDQPGDPFTSSDVGVGTDRNSQVAAITLDRAVQRANEVKQTGARVLALGVGEALQNQSSVDRLIQISGPQVARDISQFDIETTDVALIADFDDLAAAVRSLVLDLCSPSLTIRKFAQSATDASYQPAEDWSMTVTPTVPGGFSWVLPTGASGPSATLETDANGFAQYQWEPDDEDALSAALVEEQLQPGFTAGRPGADNDFRCEFKNSDGDTRVVEGELTSAGAEASFSLAGIGNEIGTCSVYNSYEYAPAIELTKVNSPTTVRGDLTPAAIVRSTYTATNPGNTPLGNVTVTDDKCAPVSSVAAAAPNQAFNVGDLNLDSLLDTPETWQFACDKEARASGTQLPGGVNVINVATISGTDPAGSVVTDTATDDVDIFVPGIELVKRVDGVAAVTVPSGTAVTYTYEVTNTGNTPLFPVSLVDDTPPCETPVRDPDVTGNNDATLEVGEVWTYSCGDARPTASVINTATVSGTPIDPTTGSPFATPNPDVTSTDSAEVSVVDPELTLTKTVDQAVVFPGTTVTYSYALNNTGSVDLRSADADWIADDRCAPVEQVLTAGVNDGDINADSLLNPGETWQFRCQSVITDVTVNVATAVAMPVVGGVDVPPTLTRRDIAIVEVVDPGLAVTKTALVPVVLDPAADPVAGPDVPDPRPAEYLYEVSNPGTVPLRDVDPVDDRCAPLARIAGDVDADDELDPGEVWVYFCESTLSRSQSTPPPTGAASGLVTNTVTVTGEPFLPQDPSVTGPVQTATDSAQVLVIEPGIAITKTASANVVQVDSSVTYTVEVTNTGDVGLDVIGPIDDKCPDLVYTGGDRSPANGLLDGANSGAAETWTYTCTRTIGLPVAPATADENTAAVLGVDPLGNVYFAEDTVSVEVLDPSINLVKSVSDTLVLVGSEVTYGFDVTNDGRSPVAADDVLADIALIDLSAPSTPACLTPTLVSKTGGNDDDLLERDPPELWHYECVASIDAPTTNLAIVEGTAGTTLGLSLSVFDFDVEFVQPFTPSIAVVKTASTARTVPGGAVTYTYEVRNTGDVPLADVPERIADDTCAPVTYVSGDLDGDGLLDTPNSIFEDSTDELWVFTCSTTIEVTTTNTVVVSGQATDSAGVPLCDAQTTPEAAPGEPTCDPRATAQATVVVGPPLPDTGGSFLLPLLTLGPLLLGLGIVALRASRRATREVS